MLRLSVKQQKTVHNCKIWLENKQSQNKKGKKNFFTTKVPYFGKCVNNETNHLNSLINLFLCEYGKLSINAQVMV